MAYRSTDFEDRFYDGPRRSDVRIAERERESDRLGFLRDDRRAPEAGPLVLRTRDVEERELSRPRYRSPSPSRVEHLGMVRRARSTTPPHAEERERERIRIAERERRRRPVSPDPLRERFERRRSSSSSDNRERERERIRIIQRERERIPERIPSPSPSPPPPPPVIRGPTIERELITHYRDFDHGVTKVPRPAPPPPPPAPRAKTRTEERELDIDIRTTGRITDVGVRQSSRHRHERSQERRSPHVHTHHDELVLSSDRDRLRVEDRHYHTHGGSRRRAHSAAPLRSPIDEEAEYITSKIESRGRMGEAWNGATKDWTIVDVPPGTERVRMDGVGGGAAEVTWQRYNGVRRAKFIPERDGAMVPAPSRDSRSSVSGSTGYERELEIEIDRKRDRRSSRPPPPPPPTKNDMWTEITRDLVTRDAIIECGYEFEETEYFFYVMQYLKYDQVLELIQISDEIRRWRRDRELQRRWEHEWRDRRLYPPSKPRKNYDERVVEREVLYDNVRGTRYHY